MFLALEAGRDEIKSGKEGRKGETGRKRQRRRTQMKEA